MFTVTPVRQRTHRIVWNDRAEIEFQGAMAARPKNVLVTGPHGWGKTEFCKEVARRAQVTLGREFKLMSVNLSPYTRFEDLIGTNYPVNTANGVAIQWVKGALQLAVEGGHMFLAEEITKSNPETQARLHSVLDEIGRRLTITERGGEEVPVHPDFWFFANSNPAGRGYAVQRLDPALQSRFYWTIEIDQPFCDERKLVEDIFGGDENATVHVMNWLEDLRSNAETIIPTRDVSMFSKALGRGVSPESAIEHQLKPQYDGDKYARIAAVTKAHFGS